MITYLKSNVIAQLLIYMKVNGNILLLFSMVFSTGIIF